MKARQLVAELQQLIAEHGDHDVWAFNSVEEYGPARVDAGAGDRFVIFCSEDDRPTEFRSLPPEEQTVTVTMADGTQRSWPISDLTVTSSPDGSTSYHLPD